MLRPTDLVIDDSNWQEHAADANVGGELRVRGLVPRNYSTHPVGSYEGSVRFDAVRDFTLIPREEWSSRIRDLVQAQAQLSDIRLTGNNGQPIPSTDQNGQGYCWAHSPTSANMLLRAAAGLPYVRLSAFSVACPIKNYRDQGGWGAQALDYMREKGVASVAFWPEKSMSRANDNAQTWENAALHKITEGWIDLDAAQYDRKLTFDQVATLLLCKIPVVMDCNWWGHSICGMDLVEVDSSLRLTDADRWGVRIWNSWTDQWGDRGMGVLRGAKGIPDGATGPRVTTASLV